MKSCKVCPIFVSLQGFIPRFRYNFGTTEGEISGEGACKRR